MKTNNNFWRSRNGIYAMFLIFVAFTFSVAFFSGALDDKPETKVSSTACLTVLGESQVSVPKGHSINHSQGYWYVDGIKVAKASQRDSTFTACGDPTLINLIEEK